MSDARADAWRALLTAIAELMSAATEINEILGDPEARAAMDSFTRQSLDHALKRMDEVLGIYRQPERPKAWEMEEQA
jgi:hypothetical protein